MEHIKKSGFEVEFSFIISEKDDPVFYSKGNYFPKLLILLKSFFIRYKDYRRLNNFDLVFIYRDAWMLGSVLFEKLFAKKKRKIILDFDDAIWLNDTSQGNTNLAWLKNPSKTKKIIALSDMVFTGNAYLAKYAKQFNKNVKIVPTTIDTDYYLPKKQEKDQICIGWTGSSTTLKHLELAFGFLEKLKEKYGDRIYFKLIADIPLKNSRLEFQFCKWSKEREVEDLNEIDIGIMPLPDDEWAKGKCGFKGLQYMALEIPAIMSPVGVNNEIIKDGENGFLATGDEEWVEKISRLIDSEALRNSIGKKGRQTVIERYSFHSQKDNYIKYFNELL